jgi:8-oxo-dGTP pyrophosphatase MutT (NUDIX family)
MAAQPTPALTNDFKPSLMPRSPRPRDAATLILLRQGESEPQVLLGQRHGSHAFMPNRYVFPGGRVDRHDHLVRPASPLRSDVKTRLERAATPSRAKALAIAAVRETFEETGLMLAAPLAKGARPPGTGETWDAFTEKGMGPALGVLDYVFRAVTPPKRPRRFNARFFIADAKHAVGELRGSGELIDLKWFGLREALALPIPQVTHTVLEMVGEQIKHPPADGDRPVPRFQTIHGRFVFDEE